MIRALIADDSAVAREFLWAMLESDPCISVVGSAKSGAEAVIMAQRYRPDVITMDIHMNGMDGFEATRRIMERCPTPIVMVTGSTTGDEVVTSFRALEAGALALTLRPPGVGHPAHASLVRELLVTVKSMAEVKVVRRIRPPVAQEIAPRPLSPPSEGHRSAARVVAIGASTGGPVAVHAILSALPATFAAPVLVAQHMYAGFTEGFVGWLGQMTALTIHLAVDGERILPGHVYVGPSGYQLEVRHGGTLTLRPHGEEDGFSPSVTTLFESVAKVYGADAVGVLLTGMGSDGAVGMKAMRECGALTICQDEATSPLFGMPRVAIQMGVAAKVLPPSEIARELIRAVGERSSEHEQH